MKTKLFAIAKITRASGLKGEVGVRPLIRQFDDYVAKPLFVGFDESLATDVKLEKVTGENKRRRFLFREFKTRDDAESMIGQLLFASISDKDPINLIAPDLLGATVVSDNGEIISVSEPAEIEINVGDCNYPPDIAVGFDINVFEDNTIYFIE